MRQITLLFFSFVSLTIFGQQWQWAKKIDYNDKIGKGTENYLAPDKRGGFYLSTNFRPNFNDSNACLSRLDSGGTEIWRKCIGGKVRINKIASNDSRVYLAGYYEGAVTLDSYVLTSRGATDAFMACYSSTGNIIWAKSMGGSGEMTQKKFVWLIMVRSI